MSYDQDVYGWSVETAAALRERRFEGVDWDAVAQEIRDVGEWHVHRIESNLMQVLLHMLKNRYQPGKHVRGWDLSILEHRERVNRYLAKSPSVRPLMPEVLADAYRTARVRAARQTGMALDVFPEVCEWTLDEVLEKDVKA